MLAKHLHGTFQLRFQRPYLMLMPAFICCLQLIIFVAGKGIATAKALLESHSDVASCLNIRFRRDVHVYYKVEYDIRRQI